MCLSIHGTFGKKCAGNGCLSQAERVFFGCWLLESFLWANQRLNLGANATILSRDPGKFLAKIPHLANTSVIQWVKGDVCNFTFPQGSYAYVIHAATEASAQLNEQDPQRMFDTIVEGTRRTIEFAATHQTKKFLLTSSGAVYGKQPPEFSHIPEDYFGAPDPLNPLSAYAEGKRAAEFLCTAAAEKNDLEMKIARCFAFVGPHLPLDAHFAIGNFIRDAMQGGPILVNGDGSPCRSYLYASDLAIWLWTILFRGQPLCAYNVGSDEAFSIKSLAYLVRDTLSPDSEVIIKQPKQSSVRVNQYIPSITNASDGLDVKVWLSLQEAIRKTAIWWEGNINVSKK